MQPTKLRQDYPYHKEAGFISYLKDKYIIENKVISHM